MSMRTICAQLFGFATLLAALLILPQAAEAHAGHAHAMHATTAPTTNAAAQTADSAANHDITEQRAEHHLSAAAQSAPRHADDSPCSDRDCCTPGCCAAAFSIVAPLPPFVRPPSLSAVIGLSTNPQPPGIGGPSLRRPPRSFA
jgi:hypothetical protein